MGTDVTDTLFAIVIDREKQLGMNYFSCILSFFIEVVKLFLCYLNIIIDTAWVVHIVVILQNKYSEEWTSNVLYLLNIS